MKLKFWEKDETRLEDSHPEEKEDPFSKDFGGPGLPDSTPATLSQQEIKPRFDEFSGKQEFQQTEPAKTYSKEDLLEAKIDAMKSKLEIINHKLDIIITKLKDVY